MRLCQRVYNGGSKCQVCQAVASSQAALDRHIKRKASRDERHRDALEIESQLKGVK